MVKKDNCTCVCVDCDLCIGCQMPGLCSGISDVDDDYLNGKLPNGHVFVGESKTASASAASDLQQQPRPQIGTFTVTYDDRMALWERKMKMYELTEDGNKLITEMLEAEKRNIEIRIQAQVKKRAQVVQLKSLMKSIIDYGVDDSKLDAIVTIEKELQDQFAGDLEAQVLFIANKTICEVNMSKLNIINKNIQYIDSVVEGEDNTEVLPNGDIMVTVAQTRGRFAI